MRTKNQEPAKISMGHLVKRDTCFSRPQAKRVGGALAIITLGSGLNFLIYPELGRDVTSFSTKVIQISCEAWDFQFLNDIQSNFPSASSHHYRQRLNLAGENNPYFLA
jgi:hypothetical protein